MSDANEDTTTPAPGGNGLVPDAGTRTPPGATAAAGKGEPKAFAAKPRAPRKAAAPAAAKAAPLASPHTLEDVAETAAEAETRLHDTLEGVRQKAEALSRQARDWASVRQDKAMDLVEERPLTVVAAAFVVGVLIGSLAAR